MKQAINMLKKNIELCIDLETLLVMDAIVREGKSYHGVLTKCDEDRLVFVEDIPYPEKRNARVFRGDHITVTRRDDGLLRLNFRPLGVMNASSVEKYAQEVCDEIRNALYGLLEKGVQGK